MSMCSYSLIKRMDNNNNYHRGDLTDIIRPGAATAADSPAEWQFPSSIPVTFSTRPGPDDFGDPFAHFGDPLLQPPVLPAGFGSAAAAAETSSRRPNFLSTPQIPPRGFRPPHLQISSPRNTGMRRRKSQAKKVVCVPAPAPANSRSSGEIVPSDLWAWRKYGQKPIKGSPYPRGYYRCSSSKGCPARKQVERSRTDPNMLVITYTSEHNHPWPTQRNALAGSTRSQPSRTNTAPKSPLNSHTNPSVEHGSENIPPVHPNNSPSVKEEDVGRDFDAYLGEDGLDLDGGGLMYTSSYRPTLPGSLHSEDNFFADLGEIEADSLGLFGFSGEGGRGSKGLDPFSFYEWASGDATSYGDPNNNYKD